MGAISSRLEGTGSDSVQMLNIGLVRRPAAAHQRAVRVPKVGQRQRSRDFAPIDFVSHRKSEDEIRQLKEAPHVWSVHKVLYYLHALVDKSCIQAHLRGEESDSPYAASALYKMIGYFSLVGLLRMHCLLADYRLALKTVEKRRAAPLQSK